MKENERLLLHGVTMTNRLYVLLLFHYLELENV